MSNRTVRVTENTPALFLIMLDQSSSMALEINKDGDYLSKAEILAEAVNTLIFEIGLNSTSKSSKQMKLKDKFEVILLGYRHPISSTGSFADPVAESAYRGKLTGRWGVKVSDLFKHPLEVDDKGNSIWVKELSEGATPMTHAFETAYDIIEDWIHGENHEDCPPPSIVNITDGEATDCDSNFNQLIKAINQLKSLKTNLGNVTLFNYFIGDDVNISIFPKSSSGASIYGSFLYEHSSFLTETMCNEAIKHGFPNLIPNENKAFMECGKSTDLLSFLTIGTLGTVGTSK